MTDQAGYRKNVGIILMKAPGQVLFAKRSGNRSAWQFPQGGIDGDESVEQALYRELDEELGLSAEDVELVAESKQWLSYIIPEKYRRRPSPTTCIGQIQKWFLLRLVADESKIRLDKYKKPEFEDWRWVDSEYPVNHVIEFKQAVYREVIKEFEPFLK